MNLESVKRLVKEYDFKATFFKEQGSLACANCHDCEDFKNCKGYECASSTLYCELEDCQAYTYLFHIDEDKKMYLLRDVKNMMIIKDDLNES